MGASLLSTTLIGEGKTHDRTALIQRKGVELSSPVQSGHILRWRTRLLHALRRARTSL